MKTVKQVCTLKEKCLSITATFSVSKALLIRDQTPYLAPSLSVTDVWKLTLKDFIQNHCMPILQTSCDVRVWLTNNNLVNKASYINLCQSSASNPRQGWHYLSDKIANTWVQSLSTYVVGQSRNMTLPSNLQVKQQCCSISICRRGQQRQNYELFLDSTQYLAIAVQFNVCMEDLQQLRQKNEAIFGS